MEKEPIMEDKNVFPLNKEAMLHQELDALEMKLVEIEQQKIEIENQIEAKKAEIESTTPPLEEDLAA